MKHVLAQEGDRLDQIVYKYYGTLDHLNSVMLANAELMKKSVLEDKDIVYLPDYTVSKASEDDGVNLWQ